MKVLSRVKAAQALAKALHKPVLYLSGLSEVWKAEHTEGEIIDNEVSSSHIAIPYLNLSDHIQHFFDGCAFIVCDSEAEMDDLYDLTIGDDGISERGKQLRTEKGYPTVYQGDVRIYALTISATGEALTENT